MSCTVVSSAWAVEQAIDEVLVTGERLSQSPQETASSVSVDSAVELEQRPSMDRIEQVLAQIPNVQLGSGSEAPAVRGQDSTGVLRDLSGFLGGARPRATLRVDGRDVSFNEFLFGVAPLWDVRQAEVFRTPQTTTQGRNSIAGGIFLQTHDPTYEWEGRVRVLTENRDTWQGSVLLSAPLVKDQLAVRLTGDRRRSRPSSHLGDVFADADPNRDEYFLWRAKVLVEPKAVPSLRVVGTYVHSSSDQPQIDGVAAPFAQRRDPAPAYGVFSTEVDSVTVVGSYTLSSKLESTTTLSGGRTRAIRHARPGLGQADTLTKDLSVESVLAWQVGKALRVTGGVNLLRTDLDQDINLAAVLGKGTFTDLQGSVGLFANAQWQLNARWSATVGIRHESDSQRRRGAIAGPRIVLPIDYDQIFDAWLPRVSLAYAVNETTRVGLLVQRAANPGGTSLNFDTRSEQEFGAERLWNYEVFLRTDLPDGRGLISANVFLTQFRDAQRAQPRVFFVPGGGTAFWAEIINVPAARSSGFEAQLQWRLAEALRFRATVGLLDTKVTRAGNYGAELQEKEFARAPHFSASGGIGWQPAQHWFANAQVRHNSGYFSNDANTPARRIEAVTVVDATIGYERRNWSVSAFARNLFDRFYLSTLFSATQGAVGEPRKYGLEAEIRL